MIDRRFYPGFGPNWDDHIFRQRILSLACADTDMLDLGAGAGIVDAMNFRGAVQRVCGIDLDPRVVQNPFLDEGRVANAGQIPYPDNSFDLVIADNVVEHLDDPGKVLMEVRRVLRPGGIMLFKTPNKNHYMPLIARLTPHRFHKWVNKLRGRNADDTFPTLYRCNSANAVRAKALDAGLHLVALEFIEGRPEYLRLSPITYLAGLLYERAVNVSPVLAKIRVVMIATLSKPSTR